MQDTFIHGLFAHDIILSGAPSYFNQFAGVQIAMYHTTSMDSPASGGLHLSHRNLHHTSLSTIWCIFVTVQLQGD
jgi:hypothetical protein